MTASELAERETAWSLRTAPGSAGTAGDRFRALPAPRDPADEQPDPNEPGARRVVGERRRR